VPTAAALQLDFTSDFSLELGRLGVQRDVAGPKDEGKQLVGPLGAATIHAQIVAFLNDALLRKAVACICPRLREFHKSPVKPLQLYRLRYQRHRVVCVVRKPLVDM
jgi:hypothetical protein